MYSTLTLAVAPSKNNPDMARKLVTRDGSFVAEHNPSALFTTEMGEGLEDFQDFRKGLNPRDYSATRASIHSENPLFYDRSVLGEAGSKHLRVKTPGYKGGKAYYYGGVSPVRTIEVNRLQPLHHLTGKRVPELGAIYIACHFTAFAWSNRFNKQPAKKKWCRDNWWANWRLVQQEVLRYHNAGELVFVGGDFNRAVSQIPKWHSSQKLIANGGIDGLMVIPASRLPRVNLVQGMHTYNQPGSDHHLRTVRVRISA